jgi:hypothetical protein
VHLESGDDVVILEGTAEVLTDPDPGLAGRSFAASNAKHGMGSRDVEGSYVVRPRVAFALSGAFPARSPGGSSTGSDRDIAAAMVRATERGGPGAPRPLPAAPPAPRGSPLASPYRLVDVVCIAPMLVVAEGQTSHRWEHGGHTARRMFIRARYM